MAAATEKGPAREAAERIEKGIDLYAAGDLAGSRRELEAALAVDPAGPARARAEVCLDWVRDLIDGKRSLAPSKALDEDALRAVTDALEVDEPPGANQIPTRPGSPLPLRALEPDARAETPAATREGADPPWDPVPLTPAGLHKAPGSPTPGSPFALTPSAVVTLPVTTPAERAAQALDIRSPPVENRPHDSAPPIAGPPTSDESTEPGHKRRPSSSTLLGLSPTRLERPSLTPTPRPLPFDDNDPPESVTREWRAVPTGHNLPPLDVPELTEEQITELLALDAPEPRLLELEAEPTPLPHRSPLARDRTSPDLRLPEGPPDDFDGFEQTPTRDRSAQLRALGHAQTMHGEAMPELTLQPIDSLADETSDSGRDKDTNPFVKARLAEYTSAGAPRLGDPLPPPGTPPPLEAPAGVSRVVEALGKGDSRRALELAEILVEGAGGLDAEPCRAFHSLLDHVYQSTIGGLDRTPRHGEVTPDLDPRSAFLLSRLDGHLPVEDLLDVSGMSRLSAMRILALLIARGVVVMA